MVHSAAAMDAFLFGSPSQIGVNLLAMVRDGSIWTDTYVTGKETLAGFALGNLIGTAIGLSFGIRASSRVSCSPSF